MTQLIESRARDHPSDLAEGAVLARAACAARQAKADRAAAVLDGTCKSAVINQLRSNALKSPDTRQCTRAHQHAAPRRGSGTRARGCDRGRWIEHEKEKHERRDQALLGNGV